MELGSLLALGSSLLLGTLDTPDQAADQAADRAADQECLAE